MCGGIVLEEALDLSSDRLLSNNNNNNNNNKVTKTVIFKITELIILKMVYLL